jgi:hydroxymethylbilane synthase
LAAAGLKRLGWSEHITEYLDQDLSLPAIGQGALAIEGRRDDEQVRTLVSRLHHAPTWTTVRAERALLHRLEGGCQVPIAAHAVLDGDMLRLDGLIASVDGTRVIRDRVEGSSAGAEALGIRLAELLLGQGGGVILKEIYGRA